MPFTHWTGKLQVLVPITRLHRRLQQQQLLQQLLHIIKQLNTKPSMSRWLASVNNLLDQLDGEVEQRIHNQEGEDDDDDEYDGDDNQVVIYSDIEDHQEEQEQEQEEEEEEVNFIDNEVEIIRANDGLLGENMGMMVSEGQESGSIYDESNVKVRYSITDDDNVDASFFSADDGTSFIQDFDEKLSNPGVGSESGAADLKSSSVSGVKNDTLDSKEDNMVKSQSASKISVANQTVSTEINFSASNVAESITSVKKSIEDGGVEQDTSLRTEQRKEIEVTTPEKSKQTMLTTVNYTPEVTRDSIENFESTPSSMIPTFSQNTKLSNRDGSEDLERMNTDLRQQINKLKGEMSAKNSKSQKMINTLEKQVKKLNRRVTNLNDELQVANNEVKAQQEELYSAAERMDSDKQRHKEAIASLTSQHSDTIKQLESEHLSTIEGLKAGHVMEIANLKERLKQADEDRNNEVGDWEGELNSVLKREKDLLAKVTLIEEEKSTLESQITSLNSQLDSVQSRLDASTSTANAFSDREREAFEKLDEALSIHAKQIAQRQSRERELEREVKDLGQALVEAQHRERERLNIVSLTGQNSSEADNVSLNAVKEELDTVKEMLQQEKQHNLTLTKEIRNMSEERSKEDAVAIARQRQHDRETAELANTISKLESSLKVSTKQLEELKQKYQTSDGQSFANSEQQQRINSLSDEVLRQQSKLENNTSEISALRQRLQVALNRADSSEKALLELQASNSGDIDDAFDSIENGVSNRGVRRRKGRQGSCGSIRAAINLNLSGNDKQEKIANAIDTVDKFSMEAGLYMRYNPIARGIFLLYLMLLHTFTFAILVFHVHSGEEVHGDFGQGIGPGSLPGVKHQLRSP